MSEAEIQREIVKALRGAGWHVSAIHNNPKSRSVYGYTPGFADLFACRHGAVHLLEVKKPKGSKISDAQIDFEAAMRRHSIPYTIVHSAKEALEAVS